MSTLDAVHPMAVEEKDWSWLELDEVPEKTKNPLDDYDFVNYPTESTVKMVCNPDYLHFAAKWLLGIDLLPFQCAILHVMWNYKLPLILASRGASKSFMDAVYILLRMAIEPGCKVVIVGAAFRQAKEVMSKMVEIWENSPVLRDIAGASINPKGVGPKKEVDRLELRIGKSIAISLPLGDGSKIRGMRANYVLADEFQSVPEEIFNVVVKGFGAVQKNPVQKSKEAARVRALKKKGQWTDELEALRQESIGGNQVICTGTGSYSFEYFAKLLEQYTRIIKSKGDPKLLDELFGDDQFIKEKFNWKDYAVLRLPYTGVPEDFLDETILAQAKATTHTTQFLMEYCAICPRDSNGFYKRSVLEACTTNKPVMSPMGQKVQFNPRQFGDPDKTYIMGIDPAASFDNAAITVLEIQPDHRKVVYCWSVNEKKFKELKTRGIVSEQQYYRFLALKIREIMARFNINKIAMDSQGGGKAVYEALSDTRDLEEGELPIYEIADPDDPKDTDMLPGLHILKLIKPSQDYNMEANHGMLKDFETRALLFPAFDLIEVAKQLEIDSMNDLSYDTYEDLVMEIEELKDEITTIEARVTISGKESFDTPEIKMPNNKKGRLRKDRYSALLYANKEARDEIFAHQTEIKYKPVGGTKQSLKNVKREKSGMYVMTKPMNIHTGSHWLKSGGGRSIKH